MSLSKYRFWQPPNRNLRAREIAFVNSIYQIHDTFCGCDDPPTHVLGLLFYPMGPFDDNNLQKAIEKLKAAPTTPCLTFGGDVGDVQDTAGTSGAAAEPIDLLTDVATEELENIFAAEDIDDQRNVIG